MNFREHSNLEGRHAYLGASQWHWINYDADKLKTVYKNFLATLKGTELHDFACRCIKLNQKLPKANKTLNLFVNDCIGYKMNPEQPLYYSENCFGTSDAISFRDNKLKIFDLKTGKTPAHFEQLEIYAALFCLEYKVAPGDIDIELRIYQNNEIFGKKPELDDIAHIMDKIIFFDKLITEMKEEK